VQVITQHSYLYVTFPRLRERRNISASRKTNQKSGETLSSSTWNMPTVVALATGVLLAAFFAVPVGKGEDETVRDVAEVRRPVVGGVPANRPDPR
jgi:hypothetical protein